MLGRVLKTKKQKIVALVIVIILLVVGVVLLFSGNKKDRQVITNFEECITAGYPIMESYPRKCRDAQGNLHVEEIEYPVNPEI